MCQCYSTHWVVSEERNCPPHVQGELLFPCTLQKRLVQCCEIRTCWETVPRQTAAVLDFHHRGIDEIYSGLLFFPLCPGDKNSCLSASYILTYLLVSLFEKLNTADFVGKTKVTCSATASKTLFLLHIHSSNSYNNNNNNNLMHVVALCNVEKLINRCFGCFIDLKWILSFHA